jgi:hypothetical protein
MNKVNKVSGNLSINRLISKKTCQKGVTHLISRTTRGQRRSAQRQQHCAMFVGDKKSSFRFLKLELLVIRDKT